MCGIAGGVWSAPEKAISAEVLARMTDVLRHRGPDDDGFYRSECAVADRVVRGPAWRLGFRRLSIIDLELASQPLSNEDGTVWVVFNGEIYNFRALRRRLEGAGHVFRTHGDGETIVHLYEDLGCRVLRALQRDVRHRHLGCAAWATGAWAATAWARSRWCIAASRTDCCLPAN